MSYEISKHFEHAKGLFSTATSLKFMSNSGIKSLKTKFDLARQVTLVPLFLDGNWTLDHDEKFAGQFSIWDVNKDRFIDADEVTTTDSVQSIYSEQLLI